MFEVRARDTGSTASVGQGTELIVERAVAVYRERFATIGLYENRVYAGIPQALQRLGEAGARLYVATSKPQCFAEQILEHFELARHITAVYGSELDGVRSDKRELIRHVLTTASLRCTDSVMVGDRRQDVSGAIYNGVFPVGVLWGYGSAQELQEAGAAKLLAEPKDLEGLLVSERIRGFS
jgi:phosphoglycolate phosphatase